MRVHNSKHFWAKIFLLKCWDFWTVSWSSKYSEYLLISVSIVAQLCRQTILRRAFIDYTTATWLDVGIYSRHRRLLILFFSRGELPFCEIEINSKFAICWSSILFRTHLYWLRQNMDAWCCFHIFVLLSYPLLICTWFLKNQFGKIKFDELDFYCMCSL